jgi:hypothetical protein
MAYAVLIKKNPDLISSRVAVAVNHWQKKGEMLVNRRVELNFVCNQGRGWELMRLMVEGQNSANLSRETDAVCSSVFVQPILFSLCSPNSLEDAICRQSLSYSIFSPSE